MAKRFSDTNKFNKQFYRNLPINYKLFWDYICLECDHAGIWNVDIDVANLKLGKDAEEVNASTALELFNEDEVRVIPLNKNKTWFINDFVFFQYGNLSTNNNCHKSVLKILRSYPELVNKIEVSEPPKQIEKTNTKSIDIDKFYKVDDLYRHYLSDKDTVDSFCKEQDISKDFLETRLKDYTQMLKSKSRHQTTYTEYCEYFLNWHRKAPFNTEHKTQTNPVSFKDLMNAED